MTESSNLGKACLVFLKDRDIDIVAAANHTARGLEAMGHRIEGVHIVSDDHAQVSTQTHDTMLQLQPDFRPAYASETADLCLTVTMHCHCIDRMSQFTLDAMLARVLQALNETLEPDFVQWKETDVLLPSAQFARATKGEETQKDAHGLATTQRTDTRKSLPDVEDINAVLQSRIGNHDPDIFDAGTASDQILETLSDGWIDPSVVAEQEAALAHAREVEDIEDAAPLRLSAWFMSFAVVLFALPIGVALVIVNMAKGENLRLSSQTAALTGTFVAFQTLGTTASALETIDKFF